MNKQFLYIGLALTMVLMTGVLTAAVPSSDVPVVTFTLEQGLPDIMKIGESYTVVVRVDSTVPFNVAQAMPDLQYPGKGVVHVKGGDHAGSGTSATVEVTFMAKTDTSKLPNGEDLVAVVVGARFKGGVVFGERFEFAVTVAE
ncbi:MAG TPA: hypothetical protein VIS72_15225 [Anaerolineales bacterium]